MRFPHSAIAWVTVMALALGAAVPLRAQQVRLLVQDSPLAGFAYHAAGAVFGQMRVGDRLELVREPGNPHDAAAVRIEWQGRTIGYVPRTENAALAWAMDRGEPLAARVSALRPHRNPRQRIRFEVSIE